MEAEPPLYPVAGAAGPQGDEDRLGVPDGPEAPVSGDADGVGARAPGGPGTPRREWDAAPGAGGGGAGRGSGRDAPLRAAVVPRSWTSWWARTPTTTRRRRSAATTAASGSAYSRTCWRPARAACSPTASTWVGGRRRAPLRRAGPRARRGGTARGLRAGTQGSPHLPSSGSVCGPEVSHGKRNLGLPSSFTSQSAPSQMQLRRPLSGCVPGRRGGDSLCPRECVGGGLGALGGSAAILSGGAAGHGGAGVRKSCKATQGRGSRVKLPSLPLAVARSSSLGHPAVLGIGVSDPFGAWSSLPGFAFPPLLGFPQSQAAPYMPAPCPPRPPADAADPAL